MMHYGYHGYMGLFGVFWTVIFWVAVIWMIVWLVRKGSGWHHMGGPDSLEILKQRYAKGEITKKQFEEMKKEIM